MRGIWDEIFAKVKRNEKKAELNKVILGAKLKHVKQNIHDWPSSYQMRNHPDEPISGEAILGGLDGVADIIIYFLSHLHDYYDRNKTKCNRESGKNFDSNKSNFNFFKKGENPTHYELVYFCNSNDMQCTITKPFCF